MTTLDIAAPAAASASTDSKISYYGVHHLALNTDDIASSLWTYSGKTPTNPPDETTYSPIP
jgi:hypothetical protein